LKKPAKSVVIADTNREKEGVTLWTKKLAALGKENVPKKSAYMKVSASINFEL